MSDDDRVFRLTPKGCLSATFFTRRLGTLEDADAVWDDLQAFCMRRMRQQDPDGEFAAMVFDGAGGEVISVRANTTKEPTL